MARVESATAHEHPSDRDADARREKRAAALFEAYLGHAYQWLRRGSGRKRIARQARLYLKRWGIDRDSLERLCLGVLPDGDDMQSALLAAGFSPAEIQASRLLEDPRLLGRLVGPIRDIQGRIVSFWARYPGDRAPKYLFKGNWKTELGAFGLDMAVPAIENGCDLVLISDVLEAVLLNYLGFLPVAAIGGSGHQMTSQRWQRLAELGARRVTLVLTGLNAHDELLSALDAALEAGDAPQIRLVLPDRFEEAGSILGWVQLHGCEAFAEAIQAEQVHSFRYLAMALLGVHQPDGPWTDLARASALSAARAFYAEQAQRGRGDDLDTHFVPYILAALGLDWPVEETGKTPPEQEAMQAPVPEPEEPVQDVTEPPPLQLSPPEPPAPQPPPPEPKLHTRSRDYCALHRCEATQCFCFD